jgi:Protein of unknown function (DUF3102)
MVKSPGNAVRAHPMKQLHKTTPGENFFIEEINELHQQNLDAAKSTLERAIWIGELLTQQRANLKHGEWLPWLEANIIFSDRTARRYIAVFEQREQLKLDSVSDLADAYRFLSDQSEADKRDKEIRDRLPLLKAIACKCFSLISELESGGLYKNGEFENQSIEYFLEKHLEIDPDTLELMRKFASVKKE